MKLLPRYLALFLFTVLPLYAADLSDLTWTTTDGEVTITACDRSATGELIIPDTIDGNPVISIGEAALADCNNLTSITIPDGVTSIADNAIRECFSLTSVSIPDSVISIGERAFTQCFNLTSVTLPDGLISIGKAAFADCTSLPSISIPESITGIEQETFFNCTSLTSITVPDGVTSIGLGAFALCPRLTSITIPDGVTSIGESAFLDCRSLTSITIPNEVTSIEAEVFLGCRSLTSITIPDSVTSIGETAFADCTSLSSITIPDGVTSIGLEAFADCTSLTSITFQGTAPTVGVEAFSNVADEAVARVPSENLGSYRWNGLILSTADQSDAIADLETQLAEAVAQRDAAIAERDARPTAEALVTVEAERDAILGDIQLAYDEVNAATGGAAEEDLVAVAPTSSATIFDLVWTNSEDPTDTIAMTIEFPEDTVANPVEFGFGTSVQGSVLTIDYQGTVAVINDPSIAFESPVELDFSQELMGQNGFGATAGSPGSGDFNLFQVEVPEGLFSGQNYFTLRAPDGSLYTLTSMLAPVTSRFSSLELNPLTEYYSSLVATNEEAIAERDAAIAERDARPTTEELAAVEAERDARYTEDQIRALSAGYTIGLNDAGNVQMKFNLFESADLSTFAPLTLNPDSVSVVDGSICLEFAPEDRAAFFRFSVE